MITGVKRVKQILEDCFVSRDELRPAMSGIYNNGDVLAATNGHILAEVDLGKWPELSVIEDSLPKDEIFPNYRDRKVMPEPEEDKAYRILIGELFTDEVDIVESDKKKRVECPTCEGRGYTYHGCDCEYCTESHEEECWECGGVKEVWESEIYRSFTDVNDSRFRSIYLNAVVRLFTALGIDQVEVYQQSPNKALLIQGGGVRCLISPVMKKYHDVDNDEYASLVKTVIIGDKEVL